MKNLKTRDEINETSAGALPKDVGYSQMSGSKDVPPSWLSNKKEWLKYNKQKLIAALEKSNNMVPINDFVESFGPNDYIDSPAWDALVDEWDPEKIAQKLCSFSCSGEDLAQLLKDL